MRRFGVAPSTYARHVVEPQYRNDMTAGKQDSGCQLMSNFLTQQMEPSIVGCGHVLARTNILRERYPWEKSIPDKTRTTRHDCVPFFPADLKLTVTRAFAALLRQVWAGWLIEARMAPWCTCMRPSSLPFRFCPFQTQAQTWIIGAVQTRAASRAGLI
jgi:hypothetical protein